MVDSIPCDGQRLTWYKWRRRRLWFLLWVSDDHEQEADDVLRAMTQNNMQDLQDRYDAAFCEPETCQKDRSRFEVAEPQSDNFYKRYRRSLLSLGLVIICTIYSRYKVEVWCEG